MLNPVLLQVGAVTNTFNVPGVEENCFFLKRMEEAQKLRKRINECFEIASLPGITPEERQRLLTFVVVSLCTWIDLVPGWFLSMLFRLIWYDDMIWYDMIWYDMIWYDMIWYDMIWYDMIWYDLIWSDMIYRMRCFLAMQLQYSILCYDSQYFVGFGRNLEVWLWSTLMCIPNNWHI